MISVNFLPVLVYQFSPFVPDFLLSRIITVGIVRTRQTDTIMACKPKTRPTPGDP